MYPLPPIKLTLYKDDEEIGTFTRNVIPWGVLKKAINLQNSMNVPATSKKWWQVWLKDKETTKEEAQMNAISQFVVELFGNKFTVKQLEEGADVSEIMTVFRSVISRANSAVKANPTQRPSSRK